MKLISISIEDQKSLLQFVKDFPADFDGIEIRADKMITPIDWSIFKEFFESLIIVFACRRGTIEDNLRLNHYLNFAEQFESYIDVDLQDWKIWFEQLSDYRDRLVLSVHNYGGPEITSFEMSDCISVQPAVLKFAISVRESWQGLALLKKLRVTNIGSSRLVLTCMGEAGQWSRMAARALGSLWSYYCLPNGKTAPGQIDIDQYHREQFHEAPPGSAIFGIIGDPVTHSLSPRIHNAFFSGSGQHSIYVRFPVSNLQALFDLLPPEVQGLSVTTPFKQNVVEFCDSLDPVASACGVVNTMFRTAQGWKGYNTDGPAVIDAIENNWSDLDQFKRILILGAGAVAKAVLACMIDYQEKILIRNRSEDKARRLAENYGVQWVGWDQELDLSDSLIIQCTSVGMGEDSNSPIPPNWINSTVSLVESIYYPRQTKLIQLVNDANGRSLSGLHLFLHQALLQQQIWCNGSYMDHEQACELLEI